jgi:putative tryptophan/tyrosine transport system substrate-binding protein
MGQRKFIRPLSAVAMLAFCVGPAFAQSAIEHPLVGILFPGEVPSPRIDAFLQGLADNGYNEGRNIAVIIRAAAFDNSRLTPLAKDLIQSHVDVLVTSSSAGVVAAQAATRTVPIVFATIGDPVALGVAKSLAHPGGNITGITILSPDINGKRLALIKEALPVATKIAILQNPTNPATTIISRDVETVARSLGLEARTFAATRPVRHIISGYVWSRGGVKQDADPSDTRRNLLKYLQPFATQAWCVRTPSGDVSARMRETFDEAAADRIGHERKHNRDSVGLLQ